MKEFLYRHKRQGPKSVVSKAHASGNGNWLKKWMQNKALSVNINLALFEQRCNEFSIRRETKQFPIFALIRHRGKQNWGEK